jgi:feruloyl esterase
MSHCTGGDGPNDFGQFSAGSGDPETNLGAALQRWVEQGIPPERIVASKHRDDSDRTSEVIRTRPLCAYPLVAQYRGTGNPNVADNFDCKMPH